MKLSWSHKLFFNINAQLGKYKWLDEAMLLGAHWLIYLLGLLVLTWGEATLEPGLFKTYIKLLLTVLVLTIGANWLFGLIWPHRRPIVEFSETKQLFQPYHTSKAFPSDHATIAFIFVFITLMMGAPIWFVVLLLILAWIVSVARVYAGVHYPRDIVGGFIGALIFSSSSYWLVTYITQPIYNFLLNYLV